MTSLWQRGVAPVAPARAGRCWSAARTPSTSTSCASPNACSREPSKTRSSTSPTLRSSKLTSVPRPTSNRSRRATKRPRRGRHGSAEQLGAAGNQRRGQAGVRGRVAERGAVPIVLQHDLEHVSDEGELGRHGEGECLVHGIEACWVVLVASRPMEVGTGQRRGIGQRRRAVVVVGERHAGRQRRGEGDIGHRIGLGLHRVGERFALLALGHEGAEEDRAGQGLGGRGRRRVRAISAAAPNRQAPDDGNSSGQTSCRACSLPCCGSAHLASADPDAGAACALTHRIPGGDLDPVARESGVILWFCQCPRQFRAPIVGRRRDGARVDHQDAPVLHGGTPHSRWRGGRAGSWGAHRPVGLEDHTLTCTFSGRAARI